MRRIKRKQVAALLLILALVVTQIPAYEVNADSAGFVVEGTTLISYEGSAAEVTIPRNITTIGREAFENNGSLVSIDIPNTVEIIESGAFAGCHNLSSVSIPRSVTQISPSAFAGCDRLKSVSISEYNTEYVCVDGTIWSSDRTKIVQVLAGRNGSVYSIPNNVTEVDRYAFWGCDSIDTVTIGTGMDTIPAYAFSNMPNLEIVSIPTTVDTIELKAFENCVSLSDLYISPSVVRIHDTAFDGCRNLKIDSEVGTVAYKFYEEYETANVSVTESEDGEADVFYVNDQEENVESERQDASTVSDNRSTTTTNNNRVSNDYASANVDNLQYDTYTDIPSSGNEIGKTKIVGGRAVVFIDNSKANVYDSSSQMLPIENEQVQNDFLQNNEVQTIQMTENTDNSPQSVSDEENLYVSTDSITNTKYVVVNGDTIADRAFYKDETISSYQLDGNIKRIGDFSFARSGLESIDIPYGVTSIGYGAFYNCQNLSYVSIPSSVTEIEPSAFRNTLWLEQWYDGGDLSNFLVVGDGILLAYKGNDSNVTIPDYVKTIGPEVFMNHTEIETVTLPDELKIISEDAFNGCSNLKNVAGGSGIEQIKDRAFYGCKIQTIRIPDSVKSIGLLAYGNNQGTDSVVFQGSEIPKLSYEKTATRFSNGLYRKSPFDGINVAVITSDTSQFEGTVLENGELGFWGVVCSVIKEPTLYEKGEVSVRKVSQSEDGTTAAIPDSVWIYDKEYYVTDVATDAMTQQNTDILNAEESDETDSGDESLNTDASDSSETDAGTQDDNESEIESETESETEGDVDDESEVVSQTGNLSVTVTNESLKESTGIYADLSKDADLYELVIAESENNNLENAVNNSGIQTDDFSFIDFDLKLLEKESKIPITKLGIEKVTICLPIPSVYESEPVVAVCMDDNGQLEYISCSQRVLGENVYALFEAKHFSPYALLCGEGVPSEYKEVWNEKVTAKRAAKYSEKYGKKDESPDTGDYVHPKWFLAAGLVLLAGYLFMSKSDHKRKVKS